MKKIYVSCLFLLAFAFSFAQTSLTIKGDGNILRYLVVDGKNLLFYDLAQTVQGDSDQFFRLNFTTGEPLLLKLFLEGRFFYAYITPASKDTITVAGDSLLFRGSNELYNNVLEALNQSDQYCMKYVRSRNHELRESSDLAEFRKRVEARKKQDDALLEQEGLSPLFVEQQKIVTGLRYHSLFLKKMNSLGQAERINDEWIVALREAMSYPLHSDHVRLSVFYGGILKDMASLRYVLIDKQEPSEELQEKYNTFLADNYPSFVQGKNLEYAWASLIYEDFFQEGYSWDIPAVYQRLLETFPGNGYEEILEPSVSETVRFHSKGGKDNDISFIGNGSELNNLEDVARQFAGKVIYVDIWATWCGPCKSMFAYVDDLKKKAVGLDVVFLYISLDDQRRDEQWKKMVAFYQLKGQHLRANKQLNEQICSLFGEGGAIGVPRYVILDKTGKVAVGDASSPDKPEKVVEQLKTVL